MSRWGKQRERAQKRRGFRRVHVAQGHDRHDIIERLSDHIAAADGVNGLVYRPEPILLARIPLQRKIGLLEESHVLALQQTGFETGETLCYRRGMALLRGEVHVDDGKGAPWREVFGDLH